MKIAVLNLIQDKKTRKLQQQNKIVKYQLLVDENYNLEIALPFELSIRRFSTKYKDMRG